MIIKASTNSDWDDADFAIIALTPSFKTLMYQRLSTVKLFEADESFHNLCYWDSPLGYYCNSKNNLYPETIILPGDDWAFIHLDTGEEQTFTKIKNPLEGHQLLISKQGFANFKAYSQNTCEDYFTECFSIEKAFITSHQ